MKEEYVACYEATHQVMWLKSIISNFYIIESILRLLVIYCDNTAIMHFSQNIKSSSHTKHFDIKYLFVKEKIVDSHTHIEHLVIENMLVDPLIKHLTVGTFQKYMLGPL
ncbi:Copia protein, partial [Mucuna pruriens]